MKAFWESRYSESGFAYGVEPNVFFKEWLDAQTPGKLLLPCEGEGRNAVYAAQKGWQVTAFDQSEAGIKKALELAAKAQVQIEYQQSDCMAFECAHGRFDAVALIYAHFPPDIRAKAHQRLVEALVPGGTLLLEGFNKQQLGRSSGGPQALEMLYSKEELASDFLQCETQLLEESEIDLEEGKYHVGPAMVIRYIGSRK